MKSYKKDAYDKMWIYSDFSYDTVQCGMSLSLQLAYLASAHADTVVHVHYKKGWCETCGAASTCTVCAVGKTMILHWWNSLC